MIRKLFREIIRAFILFFVVTLANISAVYIVTGIAFHGDWSRVHNAIERTYNEFFNSGG